MSNAGAKEGGCCPPGSWPALQVDYKPRGTMKDIGKGLQAYVVGSGSRGIIVLPDVFGVESGHSKAICDAFADAGFVAVLPDMFRGGALQPRDPNNPLADIGAWGPKFDYQSVLQKDVKEVLLPYLHDQCKLKSNASIALAGFCWGSWMLFHMCADSSLPGGPFACGISFHPSVQVEAFFFKRDPLALIDRATCPQLLLPSAGEDASLKEEGDAIKRLRAKPFGASCGVRTFPEMQHGWVNRGDLNDPKVARDSQQALELGIDFAKRHTKPAA
ncbi:hypothetical protein CDCA_CDCA04G1365 [Cyanidium caldarium]|uniref:Dienelactone hydrolase domain-containing protein n=1 Tax=Cyanidium caldarium TaxID=2771 RepID=A0AAV9ISR8_CYACA|nr:hypothetical protein CDCA_CDCA04G1365 [Cyanidium caldarium]